MARRPSARVVLNRAALTELRLAIATGVAEVARTIVEEAPAPDETPFGVGLVDHGGWAVYVDGKKVEGGSLDGSQPQKPRALKLGPGIVGVAGYDFPARFQETGTAHQPARPFFLPTAMRVKSLAPDIMREIVGPILASKR